MNLADLGPWLMGLAAIITAIAGLRSKETEEWEKIVMRMQARLEAVNKELVEKDARIDKLEERDEARQRDLEEMQSEMRVMREGDLVKARHIERVESLLTLAVGYIDELKLAMEEAKIKPPTTPFELLQWLKERNDKEK